MLEQELIFLNVEAADKAALFRFFAERFYEQGLITDQEAFIASLYEREHIGSTYMLNGIAIPHGKSNSIVRPFLGMAKLKDDFVWENESPEKEYEEGTASIVFIIGVPAENPDNIHLNFIASICRKLINDDIVSVLMRETSAANIAAIF